MVLGLKVISLLTLVDDGDYVKGYSHIHTHMNDEWSLMIMLMNVE